MGKSAPIRWAARGNAPRESKVAIAVVNVYKWCSSRGCICSSSISHDWGGDSVVVSSGSSSAGARKSCGGDH